MEQEEHEEEQNVKMTKQIMTQHWLGWERVLSKQKSYEPRWSKDSQIEEEQTKEGSDSEPIKSEESNNGMKAEDETLFLDCEMKKEVSKAELNTYVEIDYVKVLDDIAIEECKTQQNTKSGETSEYKNMSQYVTGMHAWYAL